MATQTMRATFLMKKGCPIDLQNSTVAQDQLKLYLTTLGYFDGRWTKAGKAAISLIYLDSPLARQLQKNINSYYVVRTTSYVAKKFKNHADNISHMNAAFGYEFIHGWRIFPVKVDNTNRHFEWIVLGPLFSACDKKGKAWAIFAQASEIFK